MNREQIIERSPLRVLDRGLGGGLGAGKLGVIMARAGAGKTATLCHIGIDALMRHRQVFHVALGDSVDHVHAHYVTLFDDVAEGMSDAHAVRDQVGRDRVIKVLPEHELGAEALTQALAVFERHMAFRPAVILIDGFNWSSPGSRAALEGFRALAGRLGAVLWMTAETHRVESGLGEACEQHEGLVDVAVRLEPRGADVQLELVRVGGRHALAPLGLALESDTLRLRPSGESGRARRDSVLPASAYTLLSGGAAGAEAEFGACAEKYGVAELTFTFNGRVTERHRGLTVLGDDELNQGAVSSAYLQQQMRRTYPDTPLFRKVVQSIWHQVSTAGEVFAVGAIKDDGTVSGGTGWAVELARHWEKPVFVYDQEQRAWFGWSAPAKAWGKSVAPRITRTRFSGTGTRHIDEHGKAAIRALFESSFGPR